MSQPPNPDLDGLDIDLVRRIDAACRRFEADWRPGKVARDRRLPRRGPRGGPAALRNELEALDRELRGAAAGDGAG